MSFLSTQQIQERCIYSPMTMIEGYSEDNLGEGHYQLTLARTHVMTTPKGRASSNEMEGDMVCIDPGQFAMICTVEAVKMPRDLLGFISIKTKHKQNGLINISGFHVDPGYHGIIKFTVYNAGPRKINLQAGKGTFQIWFAKFCEEVSNPKKTPKVFEIDADDFQKYDGDCTSPAALDKRLKDLEAFRTIALWVIGIVVTTVFGAIITRAVTNDTVWNLFKDLVGM